jgi:hypothetical protein
VSGARISDLRWNYFSIAAYSYQDGGPGDSELGALLQSILIVEDEALVRLDTAESLREDGYRVHEAANASEAVGLDRIENQRGAAVVTGLVAFGGG